jgi:hypothetical protein
MFGPGREGVRARVLVATTAVIGVWLLLAGTAYGDTDRTRAADAYERGRIANERGDFARAARELALADSIIPDAVTLRAALKAATLADDAVLGTQLLERTSRAPMDRALAEAAADARVRFAHRTGRIVVTCPGAARCMVTIDGEAVKPAEARVVSIGVHTVSVQGDGPLEQRMLDVAADQTVPVELSAPSSTPTAVPVPAPPEKLATPARTGISPAWFVTAAAATAIVGGAAIGFAVNTAHVHGQFTSDGCGNSSPPSECDTLRSSGLTSQGREDALFAAAGILGAATVAIGIFGTRWGSGTVISMRLGPSQASVRAEF